MASVMYFMTEHLSHLREEGKESVGTQTALWGITAGVYFSLLGPRACMNLVKPLCRITIRDRTARQHSWCKGITIRIAVFKEFVVDFSDTGLTVQQINKKLLDKGIFGGKDLSEEFPELGQAACFV